MHFFYFCYFPMSFLQVLVLASRWCSVLGLFEPHPAGVMLVLAGAGGQEEALPLLLILPKKYPHPRLGFASTFLLIYHQ